jgi:hypothetical protein
VYCRYESRVSQNLYEKLMGKYESCPDDPMAKFAKVGSYVILFYFIRTSRPFSLPKIYCHGQAQLFLLRFEGSVLHVSF